MAIRSTRESDHIDRDIACFRVGHVPAALISTSGYHCDVWRMALSLIHDGRRTPLDMAIKVPRRAYTIREAMNLRREYAMLRRNLGSIIPTTRFVVTRIDGEPSVLVLAEAIGRWFDVANPANEEEAVPLFRKLHRPRAELKRFVEETETWDQREGRVLDLYGLENLVMDRNHRLRYLDSFGVFFFADLLYAVADVDERLVERIEISRQRRNYLRYLLEQSLPP